VGVVAWRVGLLNRPPLIPRYNFFFLTSEKTTRDDPLSGTMIVKSRCFVLLSS